MFLDAGKEVEERTANADEDFRAEWAKGSIYQKAEGAKGFWRG